MRTPNYIMKNLELLLDYCISFTSPAPMAENNVLAKPIVELSGAFWILGFRPIFRDCNGMATLSS